MDGTKAFKSGWIAGFLMAVAAQGGNWLITPMSHPAASDLRKYGVVAQILIAGGISLWLAWREQKGADGTTPESIS